MSTLANVRANAPAAAVEPVVARPVAANNGVTLIDAKNASVIDAGGRLIKVRRLSAVDKMRLARATAADSSNDRYVGYATLAASVTELDAMAVSFPRSTLELEALVARLDDEGLTAVAKALMAVTPGMGVDAEAAQNL